MIKHYLRSFKNRLASAIGSAIRPADHEDILCRESSSLHARVVTFQDLLPNKLDTLNRKSQSSISQKPSHWHSTLAILYQDLHEQYKSPNKDIGVHFNGSIFQSFAEEIRQIVRLYGCQSLLDYGSGSAGEEVYEWLKPYGVTSFQSYDLGIHYSNSLSTLSKSDIVVCCDGREHVHISDLEWTLKQIFDKANKVVFITVSSRRALLKFSSKSFRGQVHITIMPPAWWFGYLSAVSSSYPQIHFYLCVDGPNLRGKREKSWFSNSRFDNNLYNFYSDV